MNITQQIDLAITSVKQGQIIAYPTEAVFGLGCDPLNEKAVSNLYALKSRPACAGFILVCASWHQVIELIDRSQINPAFWRLICASWPGPHTWVFPANSNTTPPWLLGPQQTLAVRVCAHPLVQTLCQRLGSALTSTSANLAKQPPARTAMRVRQLFLPTVVPTIITAETMHFANPSTIHDARDGQLIRI